MPLLNHIKDAYDLSIICGFYMSLNILSPFPQSLKPLLSFSMSLCSFSYQICSFTKYLRTLIVFCLEMLLWTVICLLIMRLTYPLFHPFLSLLIILSIFLFIVCLLFWTCKRMCLLFLVSIGLLQTQALKAVNVLIVKSTL